LKLVLATHNDGKILEMQYAFMGISVELSTLDDFPHINEIPETGKTLTENAFIKAETVYRKTGISALADDTGLEIDALRGEPGVFSARYAGENASYHENCAKVLSKLDGTKINDRTARFRTVIAFVGKDKKFHCEGSVEGLITDKMIGKNGFGYDPIFYCPSLRKTFAELKKDEKNSISHRGKALRNFCKILEKQRNNKNVKI
jgi:XTP/dITP diphosphohydrolase